MASSSKTLTQAELEAIVRAYEAGDSDEDQRLVQTPEDNVPESEDEESDDAELCESDHSDTLSAESDEDDEAADQVELRKKVKYGKNGYKWYTSPFFTKNTRTVQKNIVLRLPGPKLCASSTPDAIAAWNLFFTEPMINCITEHTNQEIVRQALKYNSRPSFISDTNKDEILALLGLLYMSGVLKTSALSTSDLWSRQFGIPIFRATMSQKRFEFLVN